MTLFPLMDFAALRRYHAARDANRCFVNETRLIEFSDPEEAIRRYRKALTNLQEYETISFECGLVADLMKDEAKWGDPLILDRLTLCLAKLGRIGEIASEAERYFNAYPGVRSWLLGITGNWRFSTANFIVMRRSVSSSNGM